MSKGYFITAAIFGISCGICVTVTFFNTKERITVTTIKKNEKFIDSVNVIVKNRPLIILLISMMFINIALTLKNTTLTYYFIYDTFIGSCATSAIFNLLMYFTMNNIVLIFIINALSMVGIGSALVLITSMEADTIEYAQWKTGKRSESIIFSLGTFTTKLSAALGGAILGYWLTLVRYIPNKVQTPVAVNGINAMMTLAPAIGLFLTIVVMLFYDLTEKRHNEILRELQKSKVDDET